MALALIAEDGSGLVNANAFCDLAFADLYFERHLYGGDWLGASSEKKIMALVWGAELLVYHVTWNGVQATEAQALPFPRYALYTLEGYLVPSDEVPEVVKRANAEMGRHLLIEDRTAEDDTRGFKELEAGPVRLVVNPTDRTIVLPESVIAMVSQLGTVNSQINAQFATLLRT